MHLKDELERAKTYGDIFALVKKAVKRTLGEHRVGLMLYLGNLPMKVGVEYAAYLVLIPLAHLSAAMMNNKTMPKMMRAIPVLSQSGDSTHHHDQSIFPVSFRPMNSTVSNDTKPPPPTLTVLPELLIFPLLLFFFPLLDQIPCLYCEFKHGS